MQHRKIHILSLFFLLLTTFSNHTLAQTAATEHLAISETLDYYLHGGTQGDFSILKKAFHKDATMKFVGDDGYKSVNALEFFGNAMKDGKPDKPADRKTKIVSIDQNGPAATAILNIDYPDQSRFVDYMHLLKVDGKWKIISKIFYRIPNIEESEGELKALETEALSLLHRWKMAYINQDIAEVDRIIADDWYYVGHDRSKMSSKISTLEGFKNPTAKYLAVEFTEMETRVSKDQVIILGIEELTIEEKDGTINKAKLRFMDVFLKRDGVMQAILTHTSPL